MLHCSFSKAVWFGVNMGFTVHLSSFNTVSQWLKFWIDLWKSAKDDLNLAWTTVLTVIDAIWFHRNKCLWHNYKPNPVGVIHEVESRVSTYLQDCSAAYDSPKTMHIKDCNANGRVPDINVYMLDCNWIALQRFKINSRYWIFCVFGGRYIAHRVCLQPIVEGNPKSPIPQYLQFFRQSLLVFLDSNVEVSFCYCNIPDVVKVLCKNTPLGLQAVVFDVNRLLKGAVVQLGRCNLVMQCLLGSRVEQP